jgi:hypothetical protein
VGSSWPEKSGYFRGISLLALPVETMKATNVKGNIERATERIEVSDVTYEELRLHLILRDSRLRFANCDGRKVDSGRMHSLLRQITREPANSASQFQ